MSKGEVLKKGTDTSEWVIFGRNSVLEALRSKTGIEKIYLTYGSRQGVVQRIIASANELCIPVQEVSRSKMDSLAQTDKHQGVAASVRQKAYCSVEDILAYSRIKEELPFIVLCDGIEDPHNLGAVLRTAEAAGVHGVVIPRHRSAGLTAAVVKASAGALFHIEVAQVTNMVRTMKELKQQGIWLYGAEGAADTVLYESNFREAVGLVIGGEGTGLSHSVKQTCDFLVSIPMTGLVGSLNASVAAGVLIYEVLRQRTGQ